MIIHISPSYKPAFIYGGTTASVSKLCEVLNARGCELQVLCTTANGGRELDVPVNAVSLVDGVKVLYCHRLTKNHMHFSIMLLWKLYRIVKNEASIVVHIHSWWNFPAILSLFMVRLLKVPAVLSPRGMLTNYSFNNSNAILKKSFHKLVGKWLLQYPHLHATSLKEQKDIFEMTGNKNIAVIPNLIYIPENVRCNHNACPSNCFRLLFLSRIHEKKGLELLFHAVRKLPFKWHLTIAGTGDTTYTRRLHQLASSLKITDSLCWTGHIANAHKYRCLADHDLLVLPSYNENFGNVVLEALLSGTPVLVSEHVGLSDYIRKTGLGWVTPLDKDSLVHKLIQARAHTDRRARIRLIAPSRVRGDFSENQLIQKYLQLYRKFV